MITVSTGKIYLFSYAYGTPNPDLDLDILVVMSDEAEIRKIDAMIKIRVAIRDDIADIIVVKKIPSSKENPPLFLKG